MINRPMKKYPHQQFIEENKIDLDDLPNMLQKRINGFEELQEDLKHTTGSDNIALQNKLDYLSNQLEEDLEQHFEDLLENNEEEEVQEEKPAMVTAPKIKKPEKVIPIIKEEPKALPIQMEVPVLSKPVIQEQTDESIIEKLLKEKRDKVLPAELKAKGFRGELNNKVVTAGKFQLKKGKYDTCYRIALKGY